MVTGSMNFKKGISPMAFGSPKSIGFGFGFVTRGAVTVNCGS
jgi:hypothetical protein